MQPLICIIAFLLVNGIGAWRPRKGDSQPVRDFYRMYECLQGNRCQRTPRPSSDPNPGVSQHPSLAACRLVCSSAAGLWPIPSGPIVTGSNYVQVHPGNFQFVNVNEVTDSAMRSFISNAIDVFLSNLNAACGEHCQPVDNSVIVRFKIESSDLELDWETNEGYDLEIAVSKSSGGFRGYEFSVDIAAQTVYGARHGLETLSQLIAAAPSSATTTRGLPRGGGGNQLLMLDSAKIRDKPVFQHRGLLIDTGRNFLPVPDILRAIDALSSVKMNVLHWHATDSQSFPLEIQSEPLMHTYGAYDADKFYSLKSMQLIARYGKSRGVRVVLEVDSPSHAGAGWDWTDDRNLGNLSVCVNQQPWRNYCVQPPCGQLNPVNPNVFEVLRNVYRDLLGVFGRKNFMHLGGDELFVNCWNSTEEVVEGMAKMGLGRTNEDFLKLWSAFHRRQREILNEEGEDKSEDKVILWSSQLTEPETIGNHLSKDQFIVQTWVEADKDLNKQLLELGYKLIISTKDAWYLDHGFWGVTRYHTWRDVYKNQIPQHPGVLGGEACMWGEYVSDGNLESRVWPRAAAVAERLWSDPAKIGTAEAEPRLQAHIDRLKRRRILPEAIAPEWCNQHEGQCL